jgi:hypothetical protein
MKYRLDNGMEYDAPERFVQAYVSMKEKADNADKTLAKEREEHKTAISKLEAERDTAKDRADKVGAEAKKAKEDVAARASVEVKEDMADLDIKKAVIAAVFPKADLKDKDEAYISARYDSAMETLENRADGESRTVVGDIPSTETRTDSKSQTKKRLPRRFHGQRPATAGFDAFHRDKSSIFHPFQHG